MGEKNFCATFLIADNIEGGILPPSSIFSPIISVNVGLPEADQQVAR